MTKTKNYVPTEKGFKAALKAIEVTQKLQYSLEDIEEDSPLDCLHYLASTPTYQDKETGETRYKHEIENSLEHIIMSMFAALYTASVHFRMNEFTPDRYTQIKSLIEKSIKTTGNQNMDSDLFQEAKSRSPGAIRLRKSSPGVTSRITLNVQDFYCMENKKR